MRENELGSHRVPGTKIVILKDVACIGWIVKATYIDGTEESVFIPHEIMQSLAKIVYDDMITVPSKVKEA